MDYKEIFENNRIWAENMKASDSEFFEHLSKEQGPEYLIIACSDSRVPPETICGAEPGEFFVHRNIANLVSSDDQNLMTVIAFAIKHLEVKHIVVCGHTNCGGVHASLKPDKGGPLDPWLNKIRLVEQENLSKLDGLPDQASRYQRLIEFNTIQQCRNLAEMDIVKASVERTSYPHIHAWMFYLGTGQLEDLNFDETPAII